MSHISRRLGAPLVAVVSLGTALVGGTVAAAAAEPVPPAVAGLTWLSQELEANDGMLTVTFGTDVYPDPGLTIDAVLAELAGDRGDDLAVQAAVAALDAATFDYVNQGSTFAADRAANATAKALLLEQVLGADLGPDVDLEADLRSLMATTGDEIGRFNDTDLQGYGNYANGLGQALAVLALDRTAAGVPAEAVELLLDQQCPDGSFRLYYFGAVTSYEPYETVADVTCTDPAQGDLDATALAVQALLVAPGDAAAAAAATAVDHLLAVQEPSGGFTGTGSTNANTTGLVAQALRAAGQTVAADEAAAFLAELQLVECDDFGAMAYDAAGLGAGIDANRDQWIRATAQGVLGLGLPSYGGIGSTPAVAAGLAPIACPAPPPPPPDEPTLALSTTSVTAGSTISLDATGFDPEEVVDVTIFSTPLLLASPAADAAGALSTTVTIPADLEPGVHRLELVGRTSGTTVSASIEVTAVPAAQGGPTLPATGARTGTETSVGLTLLAAGALLLSLSRRIGKHPAVDTLSSGR